MSSSKWGSFAYWKQIYKDNNGGIESPFSAEPLTENSIYYWNQMSAPLPYALTSGVWGCFPEPKALTGFIRYIVFPEFFEIWLVRDEWDNIIFRHASSLEKNLQVMDQRFEEIVDQIKKSKSRIGMIFMRVREDIF